ncbi:hypothetical protein HELRODRAFT_78607, partial [Helobdella robusta]|uniref:Atg6 BARA domain-containing protein n=1 Tax=Helobdella robusta TaxID=6412 RepID=T1G3D7_HELRO
QECTDGLLDHLDEELKEAENENKMYRKLLEKLKKGEDDGGEGGDSEDLDGELKKLLQETDQLEKEIQAEEVKHKSLLLDIIKEKNISKELDEASNRYHCEYNEFRRQVNECEDAYRSVQNQLRYATTQLQKMGKINVFNTCFHIWHSGQFGTINGFRLGRLPGISVDWNEINIAWGQTVLLLYSLANKINFTFKRYRLVPYGNHSFLECLTEKREKYPLYGLGTFKFYWDTKFDQAMAAFLDCLQQFKEELERLDPTCCLPYKMDKGKIEDVEDGLWYSIKIQFNSEEQWTKALKFMLTNLKWALMWVANEDSKQNNEIINRYIRVPDDDVASNTSRSSSNVASDATAVAAFVAAATTPTTTAASNNKTPSKNNNNKNKLTGDSSGNSNNILSNINKSKVSSGVSGSSSNNNNNNNRGIFKKNS